MIFGKHSMFSLRSLLTQGPMRPGGPHPGRTMRKLRHIPPGGTCSSGQFSPWAPPSKFYFDFAQLFAEKVPLGPSVGHESLLFCSDHWSRGIALSASRS